MPPRMLAHRSAVSRVTDRARPRLIGKQLPGALLQLRRVCVQDNLLPVHKVVRQVRLVVAQLRDANTGEFEESLVGAGSISVRGHFAKVLVNVYSNTRS